MLKDRKPLVTLQILGPARTWDVTHASSQQPKEHVSRFLSFRLRRRLLPAAPALVIWLKGEMGVFSSVITKEIPFFTVCLQEL